MNGRKNIGKAILPMKISKHIYKDEAGTLLAFSVERGDVTDSPYSGFNCCGYTGDDIGHTVACRKALCDELGISEERFFTAVQTHSANVAIAGKDDLNGVDGIVTAERNALVGVFTADCVAMLFYDMKNKVAAAAHAGWKGTMNNIAGETVAKMLSQGAELGEIRVIFGPSICQKCFEVGDEVVELFADRRLPVDKVVVRNALTSKAHIDLVESNIYWLVKAGVHHENISKSGLCTKCEPERFFSARTLGVRSGRVLTAIVML